MKPAYGKHLNLYLSKKHHRGLKMLAARYSIPMAKVLVYALERTFPDWLKNEYEPLPKEDGLERRGNASQGQDSDF